WAAHDLLASLDATIQVDRQSRVVTHGIVTSAGVSAGIDICVRGGGTAVWQGGRRRNRALHRVPADLQVPLKPGTTYLGATSRTLTRRRSAKAFALQMLYVVSLQPELCRRPGGCDIVSRHIWARRSSNAS